MNGPEEDAPVGRAIKQLRANFKKYSLFKFYFNGILLIELKSVTVVAEMTIF